MNCRSVGEIPILSLMLVNVVMLASIPQSTTANSEWRQRVDYEIDVMLLDSLRTLKGSAGITYHNNSPDTLNTLWFRLPPAALRGGSHVDLREKNALAKLPESDWGDLRIDSCRAEAHQVKFNQDGSIGHLQLQPAIAPGDSACFTLAFHTRFPAGDAASRIEYKDGQYKGAYWYPMICPYTPDYGWTVNRFYGTAEAYGEFGDFIVRYTVPNKFIVAATGVLVNESEVLPPERLSGISLNNSNPDPIPEGEKGEKPVTWIYRAENVTDVAFAADPRFLIERIDFGHFESWSFTRRGREADFDDAAEIAGWTIQQLEGIYGPYPWKRVVVTDSWAGMEYPMLTMMSSSTPKYHYFLIHEVVHNYTPMILHSNSVDAPFLDEGFTCFIEHVLAERLAGTPYNRVDVQEEGLFKRSFFIRNDVKRGKRPYLEAVLDGEDLPMVRGADIAEDYPLLRVSTYYKTPVMLNALRYVIGEQAFWSGMRTYYHENAHTHVNDTDMRISMEKCAERPLGWFFQQFLHDSGDIDYKLSDFKVSGIFSADRGQIGWKTTLSISRKGEVRLPVRLGLITADYDTICGEIAFISTDPSFQGYERWGTWDQMHEPDYEISIEVETPPSKKPVAVMLDPDQLLVDRNPLDNRLPNPPTMSEFDAALWPIAEPPVDKYRLTYGPSFGFDRDSGMMPGARVAGGYLEREQRFFTELLVPLEDSKRWPQFRAGFAHPLMRGFGPLQGSIYFGRIHRDSWFEGGFERYWRVWRPEYYEMNLAIRIGTWQRDAEAGSVNSESLDNGTGKGISPYFKTCFEISSPEINNPWRQELCWTQGVGETGFSAVEWSGQLIVPMAMEFEGIAEARLSHYLESTPERFRSGLSGGSSYDFLGQPLAGGVWAEGSGRNLLPSPFAYATLMPGIPLLSVDRNVVCSFAVRRSLPKYLMDNGLGQIDSLLAEVKWGFYQAGGIFKSSSILRSELVEPEFAVEMGAEISLPDLYGLRMIFRWSPWNACGSFDGEVRRSVPGKWSWKDWGNKFNLLIDLSRDRFGRSFK